MVLALWTALVRLSNRHIATMLTVVVAVAPATQGLLSWMSLAAYILMSAFLLSGFVLLTGHGRRVTVLAGWVLLFLGLLSREAAFVLLPGAFGLYFFVQGRRVSALFFPVLCALAWVLLHPSPRLSIAALTTDLPLFLRGSLLTAGVMGASVVRNLGLLTIAPFVVALWPFRVLALVPVLLLAVLTPYGQFLLLILLTLSVLRRSSDALFGVAWAAMTVGSVVAYGSFAPRNSFELLVGLALGLAPSMKRLSRNRLLLLQPFVLWHVATCLWPNMLFSSECGRSIVYYADQRYRALRQVTECREREWLTLAGKAHAQWVLTTSAALGCGQSNERIEPLWRAGDLHRIGRPVLLHGLHYEYRVDYAFDHTHLWEWSPLTWALFEPGSKGRRAIPHPRESPSNSSGIVIPNDDLRICVLDSVRKDPPLGRSRASTHWRAGSSELIDRSSVDAWLDEVWRREAERQDPTTVFTSGSFLELELGRLLVGDDGWLDTGELHYLREKARR